MRILSDDFVAGWTDRMLNIHPALLPSYKGLHTHERALADGVKIHGATVHFVVPEMDSGPIIMQGAVAVREDDTPDALAERVLRIEHRIYPDALRLVASNGARIDGEAVAGAAEDGRLGGDPQPAQPSRSLIELVEGSVIHSDDRILVIDKPSGVAVHGGSGMSFGVIEALRRQRPQSKFLELAHRLDRETSGILLVGKKRLVHRLDRDTSGCLIVARSRSGLTVLHHLIREGKVGKSYLALVAGRWPFGTKRVDAALSTDERRHGERHVRVSGDGKASVSVFKPLQFFGRRATLMEVDILTGRTHQIRVHAAHVGHPVLGDDKYGDRTLNRQIRSLGLKRIFLHARSIAFDWPDSGAPFHASAPLPADLSAMIATLAGEG